MTKIARALEGVDTHPGVTQIEGYRHYPVVVEAVAQALGEGASDLAFAADEEGGTVVDSLVLGIVNAIPETGRVPVAATEQGGSKNEQHDTSVHEGEEEVTDEQIDNLIQSVS